MSQASSSNVSLQDPPVIPPDSPGSSVSTRLQEEYDELLKYAVVVPEYNPREVRGKLSDTRGIFNSRDEDIITVGASQQAAMDGAQRRESLEEEGEKTSISRPNNSAEQLPDFGQSSIDSQVRTSDTSADDHGRGGSFMRSMFPDARGWERDTRETVHLTTIDPDLGKMETLMDQWSLDLKRNVLSEFSQAKTVIEQRCRTELLKETNRHAQEKAALIKELDGMKEFLHTYQKTMERKDVIISNLTTAVFRQRDKTLLTRNFSNWRIQHNDAKRAQFAQQLAKLHHERTLSRRVLSAWFSLIHGKWRNRAEKACQGKAQEVCMQLTADYEAKIGQLNAELEAMRVEIRHLQGQREKYEGAMKKAFMRGVCALNMEAMTIFHEKSSDEGIERDPRMPDYGSGNEEFSNNFGSYAPEKAPAAYKSIPQEGACDSDTADDTSPRIVTSVGTRPHTTSTGPRPTSAKQMSTATTTTTTGSHKPRVSFKMPGKSSGSGGRSKSPIVRHGPVPSVVVERHQPVNKQTIGKATAVHNQRPPDERNFRRLAGQDGLGGARHVQSVRMVD
ncbi:centrosomal protein POC5-like isoform X1 [Littorina saxatilis]|uniref:centrosomal protein POC5-like isoform X1 n=2 Tax=Littorina saxatilis TaxID=31220 RepID=UPI0038B58D3D